MEKKKETTRNIQLLTTPTATPTNGQTTMKHKCNWCKSEERGLRDGGWRIFSNISMSKDLK